MRPDKHNNAGTSPVQREIMPHTAEQIALHVTRYRDADGQPACAADFTAGLVCRFYMTQRFGAHETCNFAEKTWPRGLWQPLVRRKNGSGTLIPLDACPVWHDAELTGPRDHAS